MVNRIIRNKLFLKSLIKVRPDKRKQILKSATSDQIKSINESILNIINKNVPVCERTVNKLKRHKKVLEALVYKKPCVKTSRKILIQKGGVLGSIIPIVLSFLADKL